MVQSPELLLVDDDTAYCLVLSRYLEEQGFNVTIERGGDSKMLATMTGRYDLIILNERLPEWSGIEALRDIRRENDLPVVMLGASNDFLDVVVALELGADDFLCRSCNMRELVARLRTILRRTRKSERHRLHSLCLD